MELLSYVYVRAGMRMCARRALARAHHARFLTRARRAVVVRPHAGDAGASMLASAARCAVPMHGEARTRARHAARERERGTLPRSASAARCPGARRVPFVRR